MKALAAHTLVLGLGGNLGGEEVLVGRFRAVAQAVARWGQVVASPVFRTAALGPPQPEYLNAALRVTLAEPAWQPGELISSVLELEALAGRVRHAQDRWGPRAIDLDVLVWGPRVARWPGPPVLEVPHPRLSQRRFALAPLAEVVDEDVELPGTGRSLAQWLRVAEVANQAVEQTAWRL